MPELCQGCIDEAQPFIFRGRGPYRRDIVHDHPPKEALMPCYDPPYDDRTNSAAIGIGLEARLRVQKYVQQLKDIEDACLSAIPADSMSTMSAEHLAKRIIEMIHAPWRDQS